jgi:hypothetical protein
MILIAASRSSWSWRLLVRQSCTASVAACDKARASAHAESGRAKTVYREESRGDRSLVDEFERCEEVVHHSS